MGFFDKIDHSIHSKWLLGFLGHAAFDMNSLTICLFSTNDISSQLWGYSCRDRGSARNNFILPETNCLWKKQFDLCVFAGEDIKKSTHFIVTNGKNEQIERPISNCNNRRTINLETRQRLCSSNIYASMESNDAIEMELKLNSNEILLQKCNIPTLEKCNKKCYSMRNSSDDRDSNIIILMVNRKKILWSFACRREWRGWFLFWFAWNALCFFCTGDQSKTTYAAGAVPVLRFDVLSASLELSVRRYV